MPFKKWLGCVARIHHLARVSLVLTNARQIPKLGVAPGLVMRPDGPMTGFPGHEELLFP